MSGEEFILRDLWIKPIMETLAKGDAFFWGDKRPEPPSPEELKRWRIKREWREKREAEAYALAPWLKDELEAAEGYY